MKILVVGDPHGEVIKKIPKCIDLVIITGDLGKADLARNQFFENIERKKNGLDEVETTPEFEKKIWKEIYDSSINVAKSLSKVAPTYTLLGNVGTNTDYEMEKEEEKLGIKLPYIRAGLKKVKDFHIVRNGIRNINGLRIGFLEQFIDPCWFREFNVNDAKRLKRARRESAKSKKVLKWFGKVDILLSHQPPYGHLDKVSGKYGAPKRWWGKHAGSKVVLDYIKKKQPEYVFCGHIHEGKGRQEIFHRDVLKNKTPKGKRKIGKTTVINAGVEGDYFVVEIN